MKATGSGASSHHSGVISVLMDIAPTCSSPSAVRAP